MTGFKLGKMFKMRGNYVKVEFVMPADEFARTLDVIDRFGGDYGHGKIETADDFRFFIRDVIGSRVLRMEEGR